MFIFIKGGEIKEEEEILILYDKINEEKTLELYKTYDKITFPYMIPTEEKVILNFMIIINGLI